METGIGCTIGVGLPGLCSGRVSQEVDQELSKMGGARASGEQKSSNCMGPGATGKANKLKQNVKMEYTF